MMMILMTKITLKFLEWYLKVMYHNEVIIKTYRFNEDKMEFTVVLEKGLKKLAKTLKEKPKYDRINKEYKIKWDECWICQDKESYDKENLKGVKGNGRNYYLS